MGAFIHLGPLCPSAPIPLPSEARRMRPPAPLPLGWCEGTAGLMGGGYPAATAQPGSQGSSWVKRDWVTEQITWREYSTMTLASTSVPMGEGAPNNGCCQCLCPQSELQLPPVSPGDSPKSSGRSCSLGPEHVRFCVHHSRMKSLFPPAF